MLRCPSADSLRVRGDPPANTSQSCYKHGFDLLCLFPTQFIAFCDMSLVFGELSVWLTYSGGPRWLFQWLEVQ
jgi:hypothetical protein